MKHNHKHKPEQTPHLTQTDGDHGLRFAGPDLLDYTMIFEISGGIYNGERLKNGKRLSSMLRHPGSKRIPLWYLQTLEQ